MALEPNPIVGKASESWTYYASTDSCYYSGQHEHASVQKTGLERAQYSHPPPLRIDGEMALISHLSKREPQWIERLCRLISRNNARGPNLGSLDMNLGLHSSEVSFQTCAFKVKAL